jgi:plasmid stability protein
MTQQEVLDQFTARHPELVNLGPNVNGHNAQILAAILDQNRMAMTPENLEAAYVSARTQGLLIFEDQETLEKRIFSQPQIRTEDVRKYYEAQQPGAKSAVSAIPLSNQYVTVTDEQYRQDPQKYEALANQTGAGLRVYVQRHNDSVEGVMRELFYAAKSPESGWTPGSAAWKGQEQDFSIDAFKEMFLQKYPEYSYFPESRLRDFANKVCDAMYENDLPVSWRSIPDAIRVVETSEISDWMIAHPGESVPDGPQVTFKSKTPLDEEYFFATASADAIKDYLQQKYPQGVR